MASPFLTARWEHLVFLNYPCPAGLLEPLVPAGTQLDAWAGQTLVSLVGFRFANTRLRGMPVPFHVNFEEVNLRFYVRRQMHDGSIRRAVVFIKELVPRWAIAAVARFIYNEPYACVPMAHRIALDPELGGHAEYHWQFDACRFALLAECAGRAETLQPASEAAFITEHYWGYTRQRDGGTLEYQIEHPPWRVWAAGNASFTGDAVQVYGAGFAEVLASTPQSAFIAMGSDVVVHAGRRIDRP